jgi:microcystin-dependent protein
MTVNHPDLNLLPRVAAALGLALCLGSPAQAQSQPFIGQIACAGFNFAPQGWAPLEGQLLPIAENDALFSLLGTTYGGDGQTTFGLPDARGRVLIHQGTGPGLTPRQMGSSGGQETTTLSQVQMPAHSHGFTPMASSGPGNSTTPQGAVLAASPVTKSRFTSGSGDTTLSSANTAPAGGGQPVDNMAPSLTANCFIALFGVYPSRN